MNQVHEETGLNEQHYSVDDDDDNDFNGMLMIDNGHDMLLSPPHQATLNDNTDTDSLSPDQDDTHWRLSNAVHMELQENAKLPTLQWNVNRTGSSTTNKFDMQQFFTSATAANSTSDRRKSRSNTIDDDDLSFVEVDASSVNLEDFLQIGDDAATTATTTTAQLESQQQVQQLLQLPSLNLTEIFLTSEMGQRHTNFPTHKSSRFDANVSSTVASTVTEALISSDSTSQNILDVDIDPTPLSEIKRKLNLGSATINGGVNLESGHGRQPSFNNTVTSPITNATYWSRREQLPIPSPIPPPITATDENDNNVNKSLPVDSTTTISDTNSHIPGALQSTIPASATNPTTVTKTNSATPQTKMIGSWTTQEPQYSTIQSKSHPAMEDASQKRTQYGFGRKHVVPSVPTTTTTTTKKKSRSPNTGSHKTTTKSYSRSNSQRSQASAASTNSTSINGQVIGSSKSHVVARAPSLPSHDDDDDSENGEGGGGGSNLAGNVAYERKKERAKNARMRLNESIDRLQIALNMAGTQSNQRLSMFQEQTIPYRIISDCIKCSEDAKKWDRPSFVGSAATMIQGLNAQCEALVRALHDERHARAEQTASATITTAGISTTANDDQNVPFTSRAVVLVKAEGDHSPTSAGVKHSNDQLITIPPMATNGSGDTSKRRKVDKGEYDCTLASGNSPSMTMETCVVMDRARYSKLKSAVFADKSILDRIASFLDPFSLVRCKRVCRDWMIGGVFSSDGLWQRLAVDRFGFYNVRQWMAKVEDFAQKDAHLSTNLYKTMDNTNIMPHCRLDGMLLLGESRLSGKVSAWTYLVERSNGETMRSVERHSSMPGTGMYTSLPVVQLRTIVQNTGIHDDSVVIREQTVTVDASTRRRGDEMGEIDWDERFRKQILNLDGSVYVPKVPSNRTSQSIYRELCRLRLFEAVVVETNIHARGCVTTSKFVQKSNFTKFLVQIRDGTTVLLVIPFPRDASHLLP